MGFSTPGGILFGVPFVGIGIYLILVGVKIAPMDPGKVHVPYWVLTLIGAAFAMAGLMIWSMAWKQFAAKRRCIQAARLHPNAPALSDYPWNPVGFEVSTWPGAAKAAASALGISVFLSAFNGWAFGQGGPLFLKVVVVIFDLIGLAVWVHAGRQLGRAIKFGKSRIVFSRFPYCVGEPAVIRWQPPTGTSSINKGTFTLRCVEEWSEQTGSGENQTTTLVHEENWSAAWFFEQPRNLPVKDDVELAFDIPPGACPTRLNIDRPVFWELEVKIEIPGLDFGETYLVPIYGATTASFTAPASPSLERQALARELELEAPVDLNAPPQGACHSVDGMDTVIGATQRSLGYIWFLIFATLFWNGIVGFFILCPLGATLKLLGLPLPDWFPAPIMNGHPMGVGITIGVSLFLIPFIVIGAAFFWATLSSIGGRTEVRLGREIVTVFEGIGSLGFRNRFNPADATDVRIQEKSSGSSEQIIIERRDGKPIKFGSGLTPERRLFVARALRMALSIPKRSCNRTTSP